MRKFFLFVLALCLILFASGCGTESSEADVATVSTYQSAAQTALDGGDITKAISILEEGISLTGSQALKDMLSSIASSVPASPADSQSEEASAPTSPTDSQPKDSSIPTSPTNSQPEDFSAPDPTEPTLPPTMIVLDNDTQRKINTFLSCFAAEDFMCYPCEDHTVLTFALQYAQRTGLLSVEGGESDIALPIEEIDTITQGFFGYTVLSADTSIVFTHPYSEYPYEIRLSNGEYIFSDPTPIWPYSEQLAIASKMEDLHDGTYTVQFDVFETWDGAKNYLAYSAGDAVKSSDMWCLYSGTAVVRDYVAKDGTATYQLVSYVVDTSPFAGSWEGASGEKMTIINYEPDCFFHQYPILPHGKRTPHLDNACLFSPRQRRTLDR